MIIQKFYSLIFANGKQKVLFKIKALLQIAVCKPKWLLVELQNP